MSSDQVFPDFDSAGILKFESYDEFRTVTDQVSKMSREQLDAWESSKGFVSYRTVLNEAYGELERAESAQDYTRILVEYSDILYMRDSSVSPIIEIPLIQAIVNREGIYQTDVFYQRIIGDYVVTAEAKELDGLRRFKKSDLEVTSSNESIRVFKYVDGADDIRSDTKTSAACSTFLTDSYYYNMDGCKNDRKAFVSAQSYQSLYTDATGTYYTPRVKFRVWGEIRSWTCGWNIYSTQYEYRNVSFSIWQWERISMGPGFSVSQPRFFSMSLPDMSIDNGSLGLTFDFPVGDWRFNENYATSPFTSVYIEGKSRGVGNNWVIVSCP